MTTYRDTDRVVDRLVDDGKYTDALALLQGAEKLFPDDRYEILWYEAVIHALCEDFAPCLATLERLDAEGFFSDLSWPLFDSMRQDTRFGKLVESSRRRRERAQLRSTMRVEVVLPGYRSPADGRPGYRSPQGGTRDAPPLFMALHGNGQSLEFFRHSWPARPFTDRGFAVAYVQSSQVIRSDGYAWTGSYPVARSDVAAAYSQIVARHTIDEGKVLIGGFSGGAIAALEIAAAAPLPVRGVVAICPTLKPESFTPDNVAAAARRNLRVVIMEGDADGPNPAQQEMLDLMRDAGVVHRFHVMVGTGHAVPDDLSQRMDNDIPFLLERP